jgi:hypothetical protein
MRRQRDVGLRANAWARVPGLAEEGYPGGALGALIPHKMLGLVQFLHTTP